MARKTAKRIRRVPTNKANYMSAEAFADLKEALVGALAFERGEHQGLHLAQIAAPASGTLTARKASLNNDNGPSSSGPFDGEERN